MPVKAQKRLEWSRRSREHLIGIETHIAADNARAAHAVIDHILNAAEQLSEFPLIGRLGRILGVRELVLTRYPYTVFYRVKPRKIQIVRVLHQARKFP